MRASILIHGNLGDRQPEYPDGLTAAGFRLMSFGDSDATPLHLAKLQPDVVIMDVESDPGPHLDFIREALAHHPKCRFIVLSTDSMTDMVVAAMRAGAFEFLPKPVAVQRLVDSAVEASRWPGGAKPGKGLNEALGDTPSLDGLGFVGSSPAVRKVYERILAVGQSRAPVLISGESGTGKELCARAIHGLSNRRSGRFIVLNCSAIPPDGLEAELFGLVAGARPNALVDRQGKASEANGGTLFLDEICSLDFAQQATFLRFLQTMTVQPLGADRSKSVDVRFVCATERDLANEVSLGNFRQDLYYRLNVLSVHMPPLRARGHDAVAIAQDAMLRFSAQEGRRFRSLAPDVERHLRAYQWPGNVRELLNVLREAIVMNDGPVLTAQMLPDWLTKPDQSNRASPDRPDTGSLIGRSLAEIEQIVIEGTIRHCSGSVPRAARLLEVAPSTIYRKREAWKKR